MKFVNLTPHPIVLRTVVGTDITIPAVTRLVAAAP